MRSASCARNLAQCLHCVSCRHCRLRLCMCVSPLLPWVSSAAMLVAAATVGVNCGHGCCHRCRACLLWLWVSPLWAVGVAAAAIRIVCGCACCHRHHASCCGCARCCCGPRVSPPLPCVSSVAVGVATAGCGCRCRCHPYRLWPWVLSPPPCKSLRLCALLLRAARITAAAMRVVCGHECCRRRCACRLRP